VVRNRARRRVRELARRHWPEIEALSADLVVNVRRSCSEAPWAELESDFLACLSRLRERGARRVR
jgi:ribonuclease P protein component